MGIPGKVFKDKWKKFRDRHTYEAPTGPHTDVRKRKINPSFKKKLTGMGKGLSPKDKFKRDVLGKDMSDKYKEIKKPKKGRGPPAGRPAGRADYRPPQEPKRLRDLRQDSRKKFQHGGRTNLLEELGRVEGEPSNRNRRAEVSRIHGELNKGYAKGGKAGTGPTPGQRIKARKARAAEWWTGREGTQAVYNPTLDKKLREKRPHSSPEGRMRDVKAAYAKAAEEHKRIKDSGIKRTWGKPGTRKYGGGAKTAQRAKHGIGSLVKKIITKIKPKPKGKGLGSGVKPSEMKEIIPKKNRKLYLKEKLANPLPTHLRGPNPHREAKLRNKESKKAFKSAKGKAAGGRIGLKHGSAQSHYLQHGYGPTKTRLRTGKPKIAIKGWS